MRNQEHTGGGPLRLNAADRARAVRFAVLGNLLPIAVAVATDFDSHPTVFFIGAAGACIAPIIVTTVPRSNRPLFYLGAFGGIPALTLMQAESGGAASGYAVLLMMAMIWFGLQATDREMLVGLVVLAVCCYGPMLIVGAPEYPVEWGHATLLVLVGATVAGSLRAVSRQTTRLTQRLREEATVDPLTSVLNRRGWQQAAQRELARSGRTAAPLGLVLLDLDGLKQVNDSSGHDEGDRLLRETAQRLEAATRQGDIVARLGGDEFVALLSDVNLDETLTAVERLREVTPPRGAFSAGVSAWDGEEDLDALVRRADVALYAAKSGGGDAVEIAPVTLEPGDERSGLGELEAAAPPRPRRR